MQNEQCFHSLLDSLINHSENEVLVADTEGCITHVNDRQIASWGGEKQEYLGKNRFELGNPELYGENRRMLWIWRTMPLSSLAGSFGVTGTEAS